MSAESFLKDDLQLYQQKPGARHCGNLLDELQLSPTQVKKSIVLLTCFVVLRLLVSRLWDHWFGMQYELSLPFLVFLFSIFTLMSVGLVYYGFRHWVGVDLKSWWLQPGRIRGDIKWGLGTIILGGVLILGTGIGMLLLNIQPPMLNTTQESELPLEQTLAQIPVDLVLGWFFGFGIAAFQEETIFRGFLQAVLSKKYGGWLGNIFQALIFSTAHLGMTSFVSLGNEAFNLLFRFGAGLLFGWLRMKRGTLLASGFLHGFIG